jgi:hypothetical protein
MSCLLSTPFDKSLPSRHEVTSYNNEVVIQLSRDIFVAILILFTEKLRYIQRYYQQSYRTEDNSEHFVQ